MNIIVTGGAGFIGSNFIFLHVKKIPGLPHHLSGLPDLCRKPFHFLHLSWTTQISVS